MQFDFSMNFAKSRSTERLLDRFAKRMAGRGEVCDLGCGPGHIARYLRDAIWLGCFSQNAPASLDSERSLSLDILRECCLSV